MAKIFLSDLMLNGAVVNRSPHAGQKFSVTGNVRIPAGTDLGTDDKILIGRFPTGTVFTQIVAKLPDLDAGAGLVVTMGYDRPVTDPALAYDASTNPYITGAIATADTDFFVDIADTGNSTTIPRAGGVVNKVASGFTVTTSPASAGFVDVSITPTTGAATATAADGQINFLIEAISTADNQTQGEFSGSDALDYNTNITLP